MTEKEYEELFEMFQLPAWKKFIGDAESLAESLSLGAVDTADTNDKWQFTRGRISALRSVVGYENLARAAYDQEQQEKEDDGTVAI